MGIDRTKPWDERIKHFTPSWFAVTMGTGVIPLLLLNFPWQAPVLRVLAFAFWGLNVGLFSFFVGLSALRYYRHPQLFTLMIQHPYQSLFLGTFAMGFATIISGAAGLFVAAHPAAVWVVYGLWWVDVGFSLATAVGLVFFMMVTHSQRVETTTAATLLPIVPLQVAAATGTSFCAHLPPAQAHVVLTVGFVLWAAGLTLSFTVLAIYFQRLLAHSLPPRDMIVSTFLPVGALSQCSFCILRLGALFSASLLSSPSPSPSSGDVRDGAEVVTAATAAIALWASRTVALFLLSGATFYLLTATAAVVLLFPRRFNIGFWGSTFPLGAYALAAMTIGDEWGVDTFRGLGAAVAVLTVGCWVACAIGTAWKGFWIGEMFYAPCLASWEPELPTALSVSEEGVGAGAGGR